MDQRLKFVLTLGLAVTAAVGLGLGVSRLLSPSLGRFAEPGHLPSAAFQSRPLLSYPTPPGEVRQASYIANAMTLGQSAVGVVMTNLMESVTIGDNLEWPVTANPQTIHGISGEIVVSFKQLPDNATFLIMNSNGKYINKTGIEFADKEAAKAAKISAEGSSLKLSLAAAFHRLKIIIVADGKEEEQPTLDLYLSPTPSALQINRVFNNQHSSDPTDKAKVGVFGGYVRITGASKAGSPVRLGFALFRKTANSKAAVFAAEYTPTFTYEAPENGAWVTELHIPSDVLQFDEQGKLYLFSASGIDQGLIGAPVNLTVQEHRLTAGSPTIDRVTKETASGTEIATNPALKARIVSKGKGFFISGTTTGVLKDHQAGTRVILRRLQGTFTDITEGFVIDADGRWASKQLSLADDGDYVYEAVVVQGDMYSKPSAPITMLVRSTTPTVTDFEPRNLLVGSGRIVVRISFNEENPLDVKTVKQDSFYINGANAVPTIVEPAVPATGTVAPKEAVTLGGQAPLSAVYDALTNSVTLTFPDFPGDGSYVVGIAKDRLKDIFGNPVQTEAAENITFTLQRSIALDTPSVTPGITNTTGPYVPFTEFTGPRYVPDGFNPGDKVESRVARLYYFRDAHRVAQIVNRKVKSYNRQGVDMQRQLADKSRNEAQQRTLQRQQLERNAIIKAQKTRQRENELRQTEQTLSVAVNTLTQARRDGKPADDPAVRALDQNVQAFAKKADDLRLQVEKLREDEVEANAATETAAAQEELAAQDQFRREVAAAHADPDTYVPGVPGSNDPVEQVSVSVIGEGLIHLRGPLKGINIVRTMIDQIDQPVGQVRVSVHTVQINGEREERMEVVAKQIQQYIDQSRFLSMQSSEMLRKSVVQVASRQAEQARLQFPGESQEDRDRRYLHAFFGQDFIAELETMDSEFLRTGNKLLSLHSMDTTSLSSALNLMALAKNNTRQQIFQQFDSLLLSELPRAESSYVEAGFSDCNAKHKHSKKCKSPPICLLSQNSKFESLRGFFNLEISHDETMTPLQREFIRLAQIFKNRLITELEYKQRVRERSLIEERIPSQNKQRLIEAAEQEQLARETLQQARLVLASQRSYAFQAIETGATVAKDIATEVENATEEFIGGNERYQFYSKARFTIDGGRQRSELVDELPLELQKYDKLKAAEDQNLQRMMDSFRQALEVMKLFRYDETDKQYYERLKTLGDLKLSGASTTEQIANGLKFVYGENGPESAVIDLKADLEHISGVIQRGSDEIRDFANETLEALARPTVRTEELIQRWRRLASMVSDKLWIRPEAFSNAAEIRNRRLREVKIAVDRADGEFAKLLEADANAIAARERAGVATRPLDHKKFLDMLIDDLEEKYIELLDGTRAHTANIDNYLKRVTTALDDDLNTQYYFPAFRHVREASTFYDVQFGQTETTSILANNRELAKVEPKASMEFDLPARDIVIAEALDGAKAIMDDVGALANDPSFLALTKSQMGQSAAGPAPGSTNGFGVVRDVVPGLSTSTAEQIMAHNGGSRPQVGANLENLIPDPAIYKFETGTGFEIRPVLQPDGQAVVFNFHYMYTTNIREPVRADEKHLGRIKRHFIDTDVQLSNFELREVSRYNVALKAARTSKGVPLLEDVPVLGVLFRPLPSDESSLQQNLVMAQATIFPTLFDLMGLRWAPAVADADPLRMSNREFVVRGRNRALENRVYDFSSDQVDEFLRIPSGDRRGDLYRTQESIPALHPNGYQGPGLDLRDGRLQEGYQPERAYPSEKFIPNGSKEGSPFIPGRRLAPVDGNAVERYPLEELRAPQNPPPPLQESKRRQPNRS